MSSIAQFISEYLVNSKKLKESMRKREREIYIFLRGCVWTHKCRGDDVLESPLKFTGHGKSPLSHFLDKIIVKRVLFTLPREYYPNY